MEENLKNKSQQQPDSCINENHKTSASKGMLIGMTACAVLGLGGLGFGIYEMNQAKQQISDLKIEVKNANGSTTTLETNKIELKDDTKTVVITDSNSFSRPAVLDVNGNLNWADKNAKKVDNVAYPGSYGSFEVSEDGKSILGYLAYKINDINYDKHLNLDLTFDSRVAEVYTAMMGQGLGHETILILLEDGTVEYIPIFHALTTGSAKSYGKVSGLSDIVDFRGISVGMVDLSSGQRAGGYVDVAAVRSDGTWYAMSDALDTGNSEYYDASVIFRQ